MITDNIAEYIRDNITELEYPCHICGISLEAQDELETHLDYCQKFLDLDQLDSIKDPMIIWEGEDQVKADGKDATVVAIAPQKFPPMIHIYWNDDPSIILKYCKGEGLWLPLTEFNRKRVTLDGFSDLCKECDPETPAPDKLLLAQKLLEVMMSREKQRNKKLAIENASSSEETKEESELKPEKNEIVCSREVSKNIKKYYLNDGHKGATHCKYCGRIYKTKNKTHVFDCKRIFDATGLKWNEHGKFTFNGQIFTIVKIHDGKQGWFSSPHVNKDGVICKYCSECLVWLPLKKYGSGSAWDRLKAKCKKCDNKIKK